MSLVGHSIDVAAVVHALLLLPTWRRRLERLAGGLLGPTAIARLTVLAFLHDTGKAGAGFHAKAFPVEEQSAWRRRAGAGFEQQGHTKVVAPLLGFEVTYAEHRQALGVPDIRAWGGDTEVAQEPLMDLWLAAVSHHGEPIAMDPVINDLANGRHPTWTHPVGEYLPVDGLRELHDAARVLWPEAFDRSSLPLQPSQALIHGFAGLVSLADWIGSNTRHFPYDLAAQDASRWESSLHAAQRALRDLRIDLEDARIDLRRRSPIFDDVFGFPPSAVQSAMAQTPAVSPVILEAETGSGKTEAALWRFKTLFEAGEVDALCFLLPTRVAATGIFERIETFIARLFPDEAMRPNTVLAVPGYLRANSEEGQWLAPFSVLWADRKVGDPLFWAAENSKRYFAASAAAGTVDQFLLSTLQTRHAHLRGAVLLRSLVVVDEVHASDPYMRSLLGKALQRHQAAGGHALLLSATLTGDLRDDLMATALRERRHFGFGGRTPVSQLVPADDFPRITAPNHVRTFGPVSSNKRIRHVLQPWMRDAEAVAESAAQAVEAGARVLILRNTVRQAVATQRAVEKRLGSDHPALFRQGGVVALHHGRYALPDRQALDGRVGELFGKDAADRQQALVLCATQTVEISVDCDADFMITDLAPMDVLLQRLGRLHRHPKRHLHRSAGCKVAQCVVLTPEAEDLAVLFQRGMSRGLGIGHHSAYPDLLSLQATLLALRDDAFTELAIPQHNRALVERACGRAALKRLAGLLGEPWETHRQQMLGLAGAQRGAALFQCIDWSEPWRSAVPGELDIVARTRLGLDGIELDLPAGVMSPFGHELKELTMPAWMLPTVPADEAALPQIEQLSSDAQGFFFQVLGQRYRYDRFGLARAADA